jgi:hypothetical protein
MLILIFFLSYNATAQATPHLEFTGDKVWIKDLDQEVLYTFCRYNNLQQDWRPVFPVFTKESQGAITIDGQYEVHPTAVSFTPRFPFASGVQHVALFDLGALSKNYNEVYLPESPSGNLKLEFQSGSETKTTPVVEVVYPTADRLPENLLKFHIVFNTPMTVGEVYNRVKLLDENGKEIEKAFLIVDQELWDNEMKTVTLMLDPGRIKRGLKANSQMGVPLMKNKRYTLTIAPGWKNINGDFTKDTYYKTFTCTAADRTQPDIGQWTLIKPVTVNGSLILYTNENLNAVLLSDAIRVYDKSGNRMNGKVEVLENESTIAFQPDVQWMSGSYSISINPLLEDLAGNNLNRLFDEDLETPTDTKLDRKFSLPFTFKNFNRD